METFLTDSEARILGSLVEKEMTTPDYYPLTLNALISACNQKSNRTPVVSFDEATVEQGLKSLQAKGFAQTSHAAGSRVPKYLHTFLDRFDLERGEMAVLCELLVRGPQTMGEIRAHAERITPFESLEEVERVLQALMEQDPPLVARLEREPGRKERRYMHLLSGGPAPACADLVASQVEEPLHATEARIARLEEELRRIKEELEEMKKDFVELRSLL
jgi:uncharacterized protein YceH (UPF0502 family)